MLGSNASAPIASSYAPTVNDKTAAAPVTTPGKQPQTPFQTGAQAGFYGLQAAGGVTPTPNAGEAAVSVIGSAAQGALSGAAFGAPGALIGGSVGLVLGGLNAYMGQKSARRAANREETLRQEAIRMQKEEIARDEKWRVQNRLDTIEQARYDRKKYSMQKAYEASQAQGKNMMAMIAANSTLKDRFAKMGY